MYNVHSRIPISRDFHLQMPGGLNAVFPAANLLIGNIFVILVLPSLLVASDARSSFRISDIPEYVAFTFLFTSLCPFVINY